MREVEVAREVVLAYLGKEIKASNIEEIWKIKESDMYLLEHIKALLEIFKKAKEELEK